MPAAADPVPGWMAALEARHLERLTFPEVRRALVALSSLYVERRRRLGEGVALDGAGKRAAFALYYAPLHFLLVRGIVRGLGAAEPAPRAIVDLGCGTGTAGAAWAIESGRGCRITGIDRSGWAIEEAAWNWRRLGVEGRGERGDLAREAGRGRGSAIVAAFSVNELGDAARDALLDCLLASARRGARILVVEPIARRPVPWWDDWADGFRLAGGREDVWRLPIERPEIIRRLDEATRLDHRVVTGRSLYASGIRPGA